MKSLFVLCASMTMILVQIDGFVPKHFDSRLSLSRAKRGYIRDRRSSFFQTSARHEGPIILDENSTISLPVFPLRKSVRLPTDFLTLNLYEERYVEMSEYILRQEMPIFGALYSSDKPQLVKGGVGPVVPMLSSGDIGLLCFVREWLDGMIPSSPSFQGMESSQLRRRIRLNAIGIGRFQIERVVYDGTIDGCKTDPPFILVEASIVVDDDISVDNEEKQKLRDLRSSLRSSMEAMNPVEALFDPENEGSSSSMEENSVADQGKTRYVQNFYVRFELEDLVGSLVSFKNLNLENQRTEIFSFLAASALSPGGLSPQVMMSLLELRSTTERLRRVAEWV